ncbi:MAG: hypothetical protein JWM34_696 [Ilumatobacteraceae bacterium]|nr:hypothetical protein [Ilumatobacteraceae bacterium]
MNTDMHLQMALERQAALRADVHRNAITRRWRRRHALPANSEIGAGVRSTVHTVSGT